MQKTQAIFAADPSRSKGRLIAEGESPTRSAFQRDRDRIIHSGAFRRLQYKTQVFVYHEGDYYRTRLTHSIEVAQIARSICRQLGLDEDLAEALALAHDLGHTPFGHAGEDALNEAMRDLGGFDHNEQTLRILTELERRYATFDGLNLTWETLEGIVKHNGPIKAPRPTVAKVDRLFSLQLDGYASAEAQVAALADDIAYNNHDIADGLRAGLLELDELRALPLIGPRLAEVEKAFPGIESNRLQHEAIRRLVNLMVEDLLAETRRRIAAEQPQSVEAVRALPRPLVDFSPSFHSELADLRRFLFRRLYRHFRVNRMIAKARQVVQALFTQYMSAPQCLPEEWRRGAEACEGRERARLVADYIAGMTDRFALDEHARLFDPNART